MKTGSSPRVRGKLDPYQLAEALGGAHPRVCGENVDLTDGGPMLTGSSPRVRGKRVQRLSHQFELGLIPACAGKTGIQTGEVRLRAAHPRVCGENQRGLSTREADSGSSPRVRGKP